MESRLPRELVERVQSMAQDDAFHFLIDMVSDKFLEEWRTSPPEDSAKREHLYHMVQACEALKAQVRSIAGNDAITAFNRALQNRTKWTTI